MREGSVEASERAGKDQRGRNEATAAEQPLDRQEGPDPESGRLQHETQALAESLAEKRMLRGMQCPL